MTWAWIHRLRPGVGSPEPSEFMEFNLDPMAVVEDAKAYLCPRDTLWSTLQLWSDS